MTKLTYELKWEGPVALEERLTLPNDRGQHVYAIFHEHGDGRTLLRIGAAVKVKQRIAGYRILKYVPNLRVLWHRVPDSFIGEFREFLKTHYPDFESPQGKSGHIDSESVGIRVERMLLDAYLAKNGALPPSNKQPGSSRPYMGDLELQELGPVRVLDMAPARLGDLVLSQEDVLALI